MQCLVCGCRKDEAGFEDLLDGRDPLCTKCRQTWERKDLHFQIHGVPVWAPYIYNDAFSSCLVQFKECGDEALRDVFLYGLVNRFRRKYHGYTLLLMPSSCSKMKMRGFSHLEEMFACTKMPMLSPFEKRRDVTQQNKGYRERMEMRHEIVLKEGVHLAQKVVLVDDTITTGATIEGALECLKGKDMKLAVFVVSANRKWLREKSGFSNFFSRYL